MLTFLTYQSVGQKFDESFWNLSGFEGFLKECMHILPVSENPLDKIVIISPVVLIGPYDIGGP